MGILKKRKYFIGGYEGDHLRPIIKALIADAKQMDNMAGLLEICSGVISVAAGYPIDKIKKEIK